MEQERGIGPDIQKLLAPYRTVHYYQVRELPSVKEGILVYGDASSGGDGDGLNFTLIQEAVSRGTPVILILSNISDTNNLPLLGNPLITVVCHKLRNFQQLLSYKGEDNLFIHHQGLEVTKRAILLLRDQKRVDHVNENLKGKLKSLKLFPAIDAMTPHAIDNFVRENHMPILQPIRAGKIGCAFSHISLWRELVSSLHPSMMILEDDVRPTNDYDVMLDQILGELPVTFDILFLYLSQKFYRNDSSVQLEGKHYLNSGYYTEDISAYLISRKGARKMLRKFKSIQEPLEIMITKEIQQGGLEAYTAKKMVFENIGQKTATQESILESNTYDSTIYAPHDDSEGDGPVST